MAQDREKKKPYHLSSLFQVVQKATQPFRQLTKTIQKATQPLLTFLKEFEKANPPGTPYGDMLILYLPEYSDKDKYEAARRLADRQFKRPIAPQRWGAGAFGKRFSQVINERAEAHGRSYSEELKWHVRSALFVTIQSIDDRYWGEDAFKGLRRALNEAVTKDILGPDWRRKYENLDNIPETGALGDQNEIEILLTLGAIIRDAKLNDKEGILISSQFLGVPLTKIAKELELKEGTARVALHRAREKINKINCPDLNLI